MEEQAKQVAELLRLLANENRLLILCALLEKPLTAGELAQHTPGISLSALSQHLQVLRCAGLVAGEKSGQYVTYTLGDQRLRRVFAMLKEEYCPEK